MTSKSNYAEIKSITTVKTLKNQSKYTREVTDRPTENLCWNKKPIDFTPRNYFNFKRTADQTTKLPLTNEKTYQVKFPEIHVKVNEYRNEGEFLGMITRFRIPTANTSRRIALKSGFLFKGVYKTSKPHHFNDDIHRKVSIDLFLCCDHKRARSKKTTYLRHQYHYQHQML